MRARAGRTKIAGMTRALFVAAVALVAVSACTETLPAPLGDGGPLVDLDAAADAALDAASDAGADADAGRECTPNCFREIVCRLGGCGGPVTSDGCCACLPGEIDDVACQDAGPDASDAATDAPSDAPADG